jgi:hypothetical protein
MHIKISYFQKYGTHIYLKEFKTKKICILQDFDIYEEFIQQLNQFSYG